MWKHCMYEIMSDLGKYLVNRHALCLKGSNMPRPPLGGNQEIWSCWEHTTSIGSTAAAAEMGAS